MPIPKLLSLAAVAALAVAFAAAPAHAAVPLFHSDNVSLLTKEPDAVGAIGARFHPSKPLMFVTSATGLGIYDIARPEDPALLSRIPLAHFENEDVDFGHVAGRDIVIISNDPSFTTVGVLYVFDVTNPSSPTLISSTVTNVATAAGDQLLGTANSSNGHIANCIQDCRWLWTTGTSQGLTVFDLSDPTAPKHLGAFQLPGGGFTHDVAVDSKGIAWVTGEDGTFGYDVRTIADPLKPTLVYRSDPEVVNTGNSGPSLDPASANDSPLDFLHHNSLRATNSVLAVTEEDYLRPGCEGQGSFQTWRITDTLNPDGTRKLVLLDMWTTELNELLEAEGRSNPYGAPTTANCSAHWFDHDAGLVAQGWYDQGVRFLDISDPRDITQVGYWVTTGEFWAAYYAPTDPSRQTVYALDTTSGIDVLHIDRPNSKGRKTAPGKEMQRSATSTTTHPTFGLACPLPQAAATAG